MKLFASRDPSSYHLLFVPFHLNQAVLGSANWYKDQHQQGNAAKLRPQIQNGMSEFPVGQY
jgi:hypothetical protein